MSEQGEQARMGDRDSDDGMATDSIETRIATLERQLRQLRMGLAVMASDEPPNDEMPPTGKPPVDAAKSQSQDCGPAPVLQTILLTAALFLLYGGLSGGWNPCKVTDAPKKSYKHRLVAAEPGQTVESAPSDKYKAIGPQVAFALGASVLVLCVALQLARRYATRSGVPITVDGRPIATVTFSVIFTLAIVSVWVAPCLSDTYLSYIVGCWVVAVPLVFFGEWAFGYDQKLKLDQFKYTKELSSKAWLAFVTVLIFHYRLDWLKALIGKD